MINILKKSLFSVTMLMLITGLAFGFMLASGGLFAGVGTNRNQQISAAAPQAPTLNGTWLEQLDFVNTVDTNNITTINNSPNLSTTGAAGTAKGTNGDYSDGYDFTKGGTVAGDSIIWGTPYVISNPYQLAYLAYQVNNAGVTFSGKYFVVSNDIDLSGYRWVAIGNYKSFAKDGGNVSISRGFNGNFDGDGKTIEGLSIISKYTSTYGYASTISSSSYTATIYDGLFGYVGNNSFQNSQIKNIVLDTPYIDVSLNINLRTNYSSTSFTFYNYMYVGAVAGYYYGERAVSGIDVVDPYIVTSFNNQADSTYNTTSNFNVSNHDYAYVGGLFGRYNGGNGIVNCKVSGTDAILGIGDSELTSTTSGNAARVKNAYFYPYSYVGGIFGQGNFTSYVVASDQYKPELVDCSVSAEIHGGQYVGGIGGQISGYQINHVNAANLVVTGSIDDVAQYTFNSAQAIASGTGHMGGIFGHLNQFVDIFDCHNSAMVYGNRGYYVGGLVGYYYYSGSVGNAVTFIAESSNLGLIKNASTVAGASNSTGGLIGYADCYYVALQISESYNTGNITIKNGRVGGLMGSFNSYYQNANAGSFIEECSNSGTITASDGYMYQAGGLVGFGSLISIRDSDNQGDIENLSISTSSYIGGLIGQLDSVVLKNSYNAGNINAASANYVGGVSGYMSNNNNYIQDNKFDNVGNTGNISTISGSYVGGVAGSITGYALENSYNTGSISSANSSYVGGVVGRTTKATVYNSYNTGSVAGINYVGGVVGDAYGDTVSVTAVRMCYNTGYINASGTYTGGVAGRTYYGVLIEDCYNAYGGTDNTQGITNRVNGGIVGGIYTYTLMEVDVVVRNCFNLVNVGQDGSNYVGGVVGTVEYMYSSTTQSVNQQKKVLIENCYSAGVAYKTTTSSARIGGIIGRINYSNSSRYATVEVKDSFWNKEIYSDMDFRGGTISGNTAANFAGATIGYSSYANGTYINTTVTVGEQSDSTTGVATLANKTAAELKLQATYPAYDGNSGWNFGEVITGNNLLGIWMIGPGNDGYPMLRSWAQAVLSFYANGQVVHVYDIKGAVLDISEANAIAESAKVGYLFSGWKSYDNYVVLGQDDYVKNQIYPENGSFYVADRNARFDATYQTKAKYEIEIVDSANAEVRSGGSITQDKFVEIGGVAGEKVLYATGYASQAAFESSAYWAVYNPTSENWDVLGRYFDLDLSFIVSDNASGINFINTYVQDVAGIVNGQDTTGKIQVKLIEREEGDTYSTLTFTTNIANAGYVTVDGTIAQFDSVDSRVDGSIIQINAYANQYYRFVGFIVGSVEYVSDEISLIVGVSFSGPITVLFERTPYAISVIEKESGATLGEESGLIAYSVQDVSIGDTANVWLSASEQNDNYKFVSWAIYNYSSSSYETLFDGALFGEYNASVGTEWIRDYVRGGSAEIVARVVAIREVSITLNSDDENKGYELGNIEIIDQDYPELSLESSGSIEGYATTGSTLRFTLDQVGDEARYYELEGIYTLIGDISVDYTKDGDWYVVEIEEDTNIFVKLTYKAFDIEFIAVDMDGNAIRLTSAFGDIAATVAATGELEGSVVNAVSAPTIAGYRWTEAFYLKDDGGKFVLIPADGSVLLDMNSITNNIVYSGGKDVFQIAGQYVKTYRLSVNVSGEAGSSKYDIEVKSGANWVAPTSYQLANGFDRGTELRIVATKASYYDFNGFSGIDTSTELVGEDAVITLDSNRNVTIRFSASENVVDNNIETKGEGKVTIDKQAVKIGDIVTIVANPADGQDIVTFKIGDVDVLAGNLPSNMTYNNGILTLTVTKDWADANGFDIDGEISFAKNPTVFIVLGVAGGGVVIAAVLVLVFLLNYNKKRKFVKEQLLSEQAAKYKLNTGSFVQDLREGKNVGQVTDEDIKKAMKDRKGKK